MGTLSQPEDSKFAHLIQPIRDLAANWDIDVASELEDYLDTLENVTFSFAGGPTLNFAEAALVIQGSACVYSRKVEYLHSLVYQALDYVAQRKKKESQRKSQEQEPEDEFDDDEDRFLNLDDTLEEGTGIDMDEKDTYVQTPLTRVPATLLALEDRGVGEGDGDAGNFQIMRCSVHKSGALLLEPHNGSHLDEFLRRTDMPGATQHASAAEDDAARHQHYDDPEGAYGEDTMRDGDSDGGDYAHADFDAGPMGDAREQPGEAMTETPCWMQEDATDPRQPARESQGGEPASPTWDPYEPLDPHDAGTLPIKPYRRMRRRRGKPRQKQKQGVESTILAALLGIKTPAGASGLAFPEFAFALQAEQRADCKARQRQHRQLPALSEGQSLSAFTRAEADASQAALHQGAGNGDDDDDDAEMGPDYNNLGIQSDDDIGPGDVNDAVPEPGQDDQGEHGQAAPPFWEPASLDGMQDLSALGQEASYEDVCRAHMEAFIAAAAAAETQTALGARVSDWRHKIGPILDEQAERDEFDTHAVGASLLQRMQCLTVTDEGSQPDQDSEQATALDFAQVAGEGSQWQVARNFSALLQLVNAGNIAVERGPWASLEHRQGSLTSAVVQGHSFRMRLLCLVPPNHHLAEFKAPSFAQAQERDPRSTALAVVHHSPLGESNRNRTQAANSQPYHHKRQKRQRQATEP